MLKEEFVEKNVKIKVRNKWLKYLLHTKLFVLAKNWFFQGFFDLSNQEKIYKILLDVVLTTLFVAVFSINLNFILFAILVSHTINWVTNDHFVDNLFHLEMFSMTSAKMENSIAFFKRKIANKDYITFGGIYGRISRGDEVRKGTDIDIRLIKKEGLLPSIKVCFFGHYLRCICLFKLIPIDMNIWNSKDDLKRMRADENPLIIKDSRGFKEQFKGMDILLLPKYKIFDVR